MLGLYEPTLYYFSLRATGKNSSLVENWTSNVQRSRQPQKPKSRSSASTGQLRALTGSASTNSSSTCQGVDAHESSITVTAGGFLEDDEDEEEERNDALSSPIKGKKRLTSAVKFPFFG
jgi:hypothetical protein